MLKRVLHRQRIHNRCQHTHVIGLRAVHALRRARHPAEDVAAADDEADLQPLLLGRFDLLGHLQHEPGIDPELLIAHQDFARQLEQDALDGGHGHGGLWVR